MATKKDDVTTYTKAELIKALRASVAREAKLQKRIEALLTRTTELEQAFLNAAPKHATVAGAAVEHAPPAFPWDVK